MDVVSISVLISGGDVETYMAYCCYVNFFFCTN